MEDASKLTSLMREAEVEVEEVRYPHCRNMNSILIISPQATAVVVEEVVMAVSNCPRGRQCFTDLFV